MKRWRRAHLLKDHVGMRKFGRDCRGSAAVEFALVAPLILLILMGGIEFALLVQARSIASNAARDAARLASLGYSEQEVVEVAKKNVYGVSGTVDASAVCVSDTTALCQLGAGASGKKARVTVTIHYRGITGILGDLANRDIVYTSVMRVE